MSVKSISFNTDEVRATLDGRKTVKRCAINYYAADAILGSQYKKQHPETPDEQVISKLINPPSQPGDILYVRETWFWNPCWDCGYDIGEDRQCPEDAVRRYDANRGEYGCYYYKASMDGNIPSVDTYHPSIHMPKEAARIWLRVTDVRVERLQDMSAGDAVLEGFDKNLLWPYVRRIFDEFQKVWNSTIKKYDLDLYGWEANPWVWVIEFERCEKPESEEEE
jgi:hypothetical protein